MIARCTTGLIKILISGNIVLSTVVILSAQSINCVLLVLQDFVRLVYENASSSSSSATLPNTSQLAVENNKLRRYPRHLTSGCGIIGLLQGFCQ